jgi:hypothetical protein
MERASASQIQPLPAAQQAADIEAELRVAQRELLEAESDLAREQAAVNAFRMHSRLMLDDLVDAIQGLLAEKQRLLTELRLHQDAAEDPLGEAPAPEPDAPEPDLLLPTDTPRDKAAEKRLYRDLARRFHPDRAETSAELAYRTSMMAAVNAAYSVGDVHALYDLAGELEPTELAELAVIETVETRRLRERLMQCRRRRRKVRRQLETLRQENTARLWRKAQEMEEAGDNVWAAVRRDLETARARLESETAALRVQVDALAPEQVPADEATPNGDRHA